MNKAFLFIILAFAVSHYVIAMEQNTFALIGKDNQTIAISLDVAQKGSKKLASLLECNTYQLCFPNADKDDLVNIKDCLEVSSSTVNHLNNNYYIHYAAKQLSTQKLVELSKNACLAFKDASDVPKCLLIAIYNRVRESKDHKDFLELPVNVKNHISTKLLGKIKWGHDEFDTVDSSFITNLFSPYSKALNQSTVVTSYFKFPSDFLPKTVTPCIHVGNTITALLSGTVYQSCPFANYFLILHTPNGIKSFELQEGPNVDFDDINSAFTNKDESCFVCTYDNVMDGNNKGLFIVDIKNNTTKKIRYSGTACCFGLDNEIYGFDMDDNVWILDINTATFSFLQRTAEYETDLVKCKNIRGILNYKNHDQFIVYTGHDLFYATRQTDTNEFILEPSGIQFSSPRSITNIIVDPTGEKICVKTRNTLKSALDSTRDIFLLDLPYQRRNDIPLKTVSGQSFISFSADGNLLIISSDANDTTEYTFFDTRTLQSWSKSSDNEVLGLGAGKSIEQRENRLTNDVCSVTLIDQNMKEAFTCLTDYSSTATHHSFDILVPTAACLEKPNQQMINDSDLPGAIKNILGAQCGNAVKGKNTAYLSVLLNKIMSYKRFIIGAVGIIAIVKMLKSSHIFAI